MASRRRKKRIVEVEKKTSVKSWMIRILCGLIVLVALAVFGFYFYLNAYLQGNEFRTILENKAGRAIKADVGISPLKRDGKYILVNSLKVEGGAGVLEGGEASGMELEFDYGKLWNQEVYLDRIYVRDLTVDLDLQRKKGEEDMGADDGKVDGESSVTGTGGDSLAKAGSFAGAEVVGDSEGVKAPAVPSPKKKSWSKRLIPNKFGFSTVQIDKFAVNALLSQGTAHLSNVQINVSARNETEGCYKVGLKGGLYEIPGRIFPKGELDVANFRYSPGLVSISELKLKVGKSGRLAVEGDVGLKHNPTDVNISLQGVELSELLSPHWARSLEGSLKATAKVRRSAQGEVSGSGELSIDKGVLTALPVLDTLAAFANTGRFRRIEWTMAQTRFAMEGEKWTFRDLFLASEGLLRIEGGVEISGKNLSGQLMIGIPAGLLAHIPGAEEGVFTKENNQGKLGLLWAPLTLSGTVDAPKEDLSRRLMMAAGDRILRKLPGGKVILNFSESLADRLLGQPSSSADRDKKDAGDKEEDKKQERDPSIKVGRDLLDTGLQMGFDLLKGSGK